MLKFATKQYKSVLLHIFSESDSMCVFPGTHSSFKNHLLQCPTSALDAGGLYELTSRKISVVATTSIFSISSVPSVWALILPVLCLDKERDSWNNCLNWTEIAETCCFYKRFILPGELLLLATEWQIRKGASPTQALMWAHVFQVW